MSAQNPQSASMLQRIDFSRLHVDIDAFLNPYLPPPPWRHLPRPISRFFGYRKTLAPKPLGNLVIAFWSLIGVFCGVLVVAEVSEHIPSFQAHHAPIIVASFGAAAVLEFSAIESPFAQPRNAVLSQILASFVGVAIGKLFALNENAHSMPQVGGALACAITTAIMTITNTVHPPAGATALLAVTQSYDVGWYLILIMLLGCVLMQAVALVINNIQRRFPIYWWTPQSLERPKPDDTESAREAKEGSVASVQTNDTFPGVPTHIVIEKGSVMLPDNVTVTEQEMVVLKRISERL
ncbi:HPP family-domain-containing protein [Aspergillus welwitschiae]|uniref:HPP family-domain-containing protein n=1 Tax=Aspergillus welwitschiae TaxID=1341132 RepID=A0A3F3Q7F6_9EURO|nr:HPP family-domain-containing protein [Aspergillus welwitschiae]RDH35120.1 HPP family-domain-containing protein [Aspergillus welwitschiae]